MEEVLEFQTKEECHFDTGKVWVGYLITVGAKEIQRPDECIECGKWLEKREKAHSVRERYVYHETDGHDVVMPEIGLICQRCFVKAHLKGEFRDGKMRELTERTTSKGRQ